MLWTRDDGALSRYFFGSASAFSPGRKSIAESAAAWHNGPGDSGQRRPAWSTCMNNLII